MRSAVRLGLGRPEAGDDGLRSHLRRPAQVDLAVAVERAVSRHARLDVRRWASLVDVTLSRAGLLVAGDLEAARQALAIEPQLPGDLTAREKLRDLRRSGSATWRGSCGVAGRRAPSRRTNAPPGAALRSCGAPVARPPRAGERRARAGAAGHLAAPRAVAIGTGPTMEDNRHTGPRRPAASAARAPRLRGAARRGISSLRFPRMWVGEGSFDFSSAHLLRRALGGHQRGRGLRRRWRRSVPGRSGGNLAARAAPSSSSSGSIAGGSGGGRPAAASAQAGAR